MCVVWRGTGGRQILSNWRLLPDFLTVQLLTVHIRIKSLPVGAHSNSLTIHYDWPPFASAHRYSTTTVQPSVLESDRCCWNSAAISTLFLYAYSFFLYMVNPYFNGSLCKV